MLGRREREFMWLIVGRAYGKLVSHTSSPLPPSPTTAASTHTWNETCVVVVRHVSPTRLTGMLSAWHIADAVVNRKTNKIVSRNEEWAVEVKNLCSIPFIFYVHFWQRTYLRSSIVAIVSTLGDDGGSGCLHCKPDTERWLVERH